MGGVARHILDISGELEQRGWKVTIVSPDNDFFASQAASSSIELIELPMVRDIRPLADARSLVRLYGLLRSIRPTLVHVHSSKAGFLGRLAGTFAAVPVIVFTPNCWSFQSVEGRRQHFYAFLERLAARFGDMTVAVSNREIQDALRLRVVTRGQVRLIHNAVPPIRKGELPRHVARALPQASPLIVSVGRLSEQKGYCYLVEAMAMVKKEAPDAHLVIAGDGPLRQQLEKQAVRLGVDDVLHFLGNLDNVTPLLEVADFFVLPSLWEGLPFAALEAMAAGLAIVATEPSEDLVVEGENGFTVDSRHPVPLAEAMLKLIRKPESWKRMGQASRSRADSHFSLQGCVDATESLYLELLTRKGLVSGPV